MTSMDLNSALDRYLEAQVRPSDPLDELEMAAQLAGDWRRNGPPSTAVILYELHVNYNRTFMTLEELTGIPHKTIHRLIEQHRALIGEEGNV